MNSKSNRYAPKPILSKLYIDDNYQGLYIMLDNVDDGKEKIDLDKYDPNSTQTPFILEMDTIAYRTYIEGVDYFALGETTQFDYDGDGKTALLYKVNYPNDITPKQFNYVKDYVTTARETLINKDLNKFCELVDVDAFIDFYVLGELFRNTDMAGRSVYIYKNTNGKLVFGPSWDFDYTCSRPYQMAPNTDYNLENAKDRFYNYDWWKLFLEIEGAQELISKRYNNYLKDIITYELTEMKRYFEFYSLEIYENAEIWYSKDAKDTKQLVLDNYNWTCQYFKLRMELMDEIFG